MSGIWSTTVIPATAYYVLPVVLLALASRQSRAEGLRWAGVYWLSEALLQFGIPLVTGVARWESDVLDSATMRSVSYVRETAFALVFFHTGIALTAGVFVALALAKGVRSSLVLTAGAALPLILEALGGHLKSGHHVDGQNRPPRG